MAWIVLAGCGRVSFDGVVEPDAPPQPTCTGHDEDGDGFPDACDVCPTEPDPLQRNTGERDAGKPVDEVGDACDPRPALGGDYIMQFEPHDVPAEHGYMFLSGTFEWTADAVRLGSLTTAGSATYLLDALPTRVEIRMRIVDASTTDVQWFGVWYGWDMTASNPKIFATGSSDPTGSPTVFFIKEQDAAGTQRDGDLVSGPPVFGGGQVYRIRVDTQLVTGGDDVMTFDGYAQGTSALAIQVPRYRGGFLESFRVMMDFEYFIAYAIR